MAGALKKLEVERNDGVDDPATGRKWLVLKTEDPDEIEGNLTEVCDLAADAIESIQKRAVPLDPVSAKKLERLVKALGAKNFKGSFTLRKSEEDKDEGAKADAGAAEAAKTTPTQSPTISLSKDSLEAINGLKTTIEKYCAPGDEDEENEEDEGKSRRGLKKGRKDEDEDPESSQLETGRRLKKSASPKMGEGLFDNVILGD